MYIKYTNVQVYLMYKYDIWNVPPFHIELSYIKMHTYTLHNKCTHTHARAHIHMHTTVHKEGKAIEIDWKMKENLHEKTYTVHNMQFSVYDRQSFWGRLLQFNNKPVFFFVLFISLFFLIPFFSFYTNVWHSKKTEQRYYMSICSNEVEMVIKNNKHWWQ